jgi:tetratricopeptide (TPR) repeat protein
LDKSEEIPREREARSSPVFVSYATADRKQALAVCRALEQRGTKCWIASRDVAPGENYQESIVRSLRGAPAMVLVFSEAANNSEEIKKELSLASRFNVPVVALRIADVEPSDAFAYELSTRQWIDAFEGWDRSIEVLARRIGDIRAADRGISDRWPASARQRASSLRRRLSIWLTAGAILALLMAGAWLYLRPPAVTAKSMNVRLAGFQSLSPDLPAAMPDAIRDEILAAFNEAGVVGISTASASASKSASDYLLAGTIRRDGDRVRAIARLSNERSGRTLWSGNFTFPAAEQSRVPRQIAVHAGNVLRCGLFGASTYPDAMPDPVLTEFLKFCHHYWVEPDTGKMLHSARRAVTAAPAFSAGWSALAISAGLAQFEQEPGPRREGLRREGQEAAAKALALDPSNSEAFAAQTPLLQSTDFVGQEALLKRAVKARPLDCGCEHWQYSVMLQNVGRIADAAAEAAQAVDMLAFDRESQFSFARALNALGKREEARQHFDAMIELDLDTALTRDFIAVTEATETGDYRAGISALANAKLQIPAAQKAALSAAFVALESGSATTKSSAARSLEALPADQQNYVVVRALAALGASRAALQMFVRASHSRYDFPSLLWHRSMRQLLHEPAFPAVAERLGLMHYWRTTRTKPDICSGEAPAPFCRMI